MHIHTHTHTPHFLTAISESNAEEMEQRARNSKSKEARSDTTLWGTLPWPARQSSFPEMTPPSTVGDTSLTERSFNPVKRQGSRTLQNDCRESKPGGAIKESVTLPHPQHGRGHSSRTCSSPLTRKEVTPTTAFKATEYNALKVGKPTSRDF